MNTEDFAGDHLGDALASVPIVDVEPARADRIRDRCRATLNRRAHSGPSWPAAGRAAWRRVLEPALVAGASAAFLIEVVGRALRLEGF